jgi:hypothetical protein
MPLLLYKVLYEAVTLRSYSDCMNASFLLECAARSDGASGLKMLSSEEVSVKSYQMRMHVLDVVSARDICLEIFEMCLIL